MAEPTDLRVTVTYATPEAVWQRVCRLANGATVADAVTASGFAAAFPDVDPWGQGVGVFGLLRPAAFVLRDGDRIEIYRPLTFNPMESRRRRAAHKARKTAAARERSAGAGEGR
ncbi:MAG: RnfH family protein [Pigmentiphaga sp.]|nr:RnfH family protein [Pigmentiphaga sp.]